MSIHVFSPAEQVAAVALFVHELADRAAVLADIEERTARMDHAVSEVVARYSPSPDMGEALRAANLKVIDGLVTMMSAHIGDQAANVEARRGDGDPVLTEAAIAVHDDTVRQYYRLMALRSELDPDCRPTGEVLETGADIRAWGARILA